MKWVLGAMAMLALASLVFPATAEECVAAGEECYGACCVSLGYDWSGGGCATPDDVDASNLRAACAYCFDAYHECIEDAETGQEAVEEEAQPYAQPYQNQEYEESASPASPGEGCATGFVLLFSLIGFSACRAN